MLEIDGVTIRYGTTVAVDGCSFSAGEHDTVALLGANGAGKTSLLHAVSGLVRYEGSIRFEGSEISKLGAERAARQGLIQVPEGRHVIPTLDVHENLQIGALARAGRASTYSLDDVYDLFPALVPLRRRDGWALSGGEQQMVAIGRALVAAPRLLLLDEPSLGLAPIVVSAVYRVLHEVASRIPMVVVEQHTGSVLGLCEQAVVLSHGRVVLHGTASDLGSRHELLDSYLGTSGVPGGEHLSQP
jgi:branched-chain amino acid transport system ATP-binding protein